MNDLWVGGRTRDRSSLLIRSLDVSYTLEKGVRGRVLLLVYLLTIRRKKAGVIFRIILYNGTLLLRTLLYGVLYASLRYDTIRYDQGQLASRSAARGGREEGG